MSTTQWFSPSHKPPPITINTTTPSSSSTKRTRTFGTPVDLNTPRNLHQGPSSKSKHIGSSGAGDGKVVRSKVSSAPSTTTNASFNVFNDGVELNDMLNKIHNNSPPPSQPQPISTSNSKSKSRSNLTQLLTKSSSLTANNSNKTSSQQNKYEILKIEFPPGPLGLELRPYRTTSSNTSNTTTSTNANVNTRIEIGCVISSFISPTSSFGVNDSDCDGNNNNTSHALIPTSPSGKHSLLRISDRIYCINGYVVNDDVSYNEVVKLLRGFRNDNDLKGGGGVIEFRRISSRDNYNVVDCPAITSKTTPNEITTTTTFSPSAIRRLRVRLNSSGSPSSHSSVLSPSPFKKHNKTPTPPVTPTISLTTNVLSYLSSSLLPLASRIISKIDNSLTTEEATEIAVREVGVIMSVKSELIEELKGVKGFIECDECDRDVDCHGEDKDKVESMYTPSPKATQSQSSQQSLNEIDNLQEQIEQLKADLEASESNAAQTSVYLSSVNVDLDMKSNENKRIQTELNEFKVQFGKLADDHIVEINEVKEENCNLKVEVGEFKLQFLRTTVEADELQSKAQDSILEAGRSLRDVVEERDNYLIVMTELNDQIKNMTEMEEELRVDLDGVNLINVEVKSNLDVETQKRIKLNDEISSMLGTIRKKQETIEEYEVKVTDYEANLKDTQNDLDGAMDEIHLLQSAISTLTVEANDNEDYIETLKSDSEQSQEQIRGYHEIRDFQDKNLGDLRRVSEDLSLENESYIANVRELEERVLVGIAANVELRKFVGENSGLKFECLELNEKVNELQSKLGECEVIRDTAVKRADVVGVEMTELTLVNSTFKLECKQHNDQVEVLQAELSGAVIKRDESLALVEGSKIELEKLELDNSTYKSTCVELESKVNLLEMKLMSFEKTRDTSLAQIEVNSDLSLTEITSLKASIKSLKDQLLESHNVNTNIKEDYENEATSLHSAVSKFTSDLNSMKENREVEKNSWNRKVLDLEREIELLLGKNEDLTDESRREIDEIESRTLELEAELTEAVASKDAMLDEKNLEVLDIRNKLETGEENQISSQERIISLTDEVNELRIDITVITEENKKLESELTDLTHSKQTQITDLVAQVNEFELTLETRDHDRDRDLLFDVRANDVMAENAMLKKSHAVVLKNKEDTIVKIRQRLEVKEEELQRLNEEIDTVRSDGEIEHGRLNLQLDDAETRLYECMEIVSEREKYADNVNVELEGKQREVVALVKHVEIMEKKMTVLKSDKEVNDASKVEEAELQAKNNRHSTASALLLESTVQEMENRNNSLVHELTLLKEGRAADLNELTPRKAPRPTMKEQMALSPVFSDSLKDRHDTVMGELERMKVSLFSEINSPRSKDNDDGNDNSNHNDDVVISSMILQGLEENVSALLIELTNARSTLEGKEHMLMELGDAMSSYEEKIETLRNEMNRMDAYVEKAEEIVERELRFRGSQEVEIQKVKREVDVLREENVTIQSNLRRIVESKSTLESECEALQGKMKVEENERNAKVDANAKISAGVFCLISGAVKCNLLRSRNKRIAFNKWRASNQRQRHNEQDSKKKEENLATSTNSSLEQKRFFTLETTIATLKHELITIESERDTVAENCEEILKTSSFFRVEIEKNEKLLAAFKILLSMRIFSTTYANGKHRDVVRCFKRWYGETMRLKGKGEMSEIASMMQKQLEMQKAKLVALKEGLEVGGFLGGGGNSSKGEREEEKVERVEADKVEFASIAEEKENENENEDVNESVDVTNNSTFFWELSSEEGGSGSGEREGDESFGSERTL